MLIINNISKVSFPTQIYKSKKVKQMLKTAEKNMNYSRLKENNKELNFNIDNKEGVIYEN